MLHFSLNNASYVRALTEIGANWIVTEENIATVEAIVCKLFGKKCANALRYELRCAKEGKVGPESCTIQLNFGIRVGVTAIFIFIERAVLFIYLFIYLFIHLFIV